MLKRRKMNFCKLNNRKIVPNNINYTRNEDYKKEITLGDEGEAVLRVQNMLTGILDIHNSIPVILVDGKFGEETRNAVIKFQEIMGISNTGSVDDITLRELEKEYNFAIRESREDGYNQNMDTKQGLFNSKYDSKIVGIGSSGDNVVELQTYLNKLADKYSMIPKLTIDGKFGTKTEEVVKIFQGIFNLPTDGIVGRYTWTAIFDAEAGKIGPKESDTEG